MKNEECKLESLKAKRKLVGKRKPHQSYSKSKFRIAALIRPNLIGLSKRKLSWSDIEESLCQRYLVFYGLSKVNQFINLSVKFIELVFAQMVNRNYHWNCSNLPGRRVQLFLCFARIFFFNITIFYKKSSCLSAYQSLCCVLRQAFLIKHRRY